MNHSKMAQNLGKGSDTVERSGAAEVADRVGAQVEADIAAIASGITRCEDGANRSVEALYKEKRRWGNSDGHEDLTKAGAQDIHKAAFLLAVRLIEVPPRELDLQIGGEGVLHVSAEPIVPNARLAVGVARRGVVLEGRKSDA